MKDEIKEILEGIKIVIIYGGTLEIDAKELKLLLDYITNLLEENKKLKKTLENRKKYNPTNEEMLCKGIAYYQNKIFGDDKE